MQIAAGFEVQWFYDKQQTIFNERSLVIFPILTNKLNEMAFEMILIRQNLNGNNIFPIEKRTDL